MFDIKQKANMSNKSIVALQTLSGKDWDVLNYTSIHLFSMHSYGDARVLTLYRLLDLKTIVHY